MTTPNSGETDKDGNAVVPLYAAIEPVAASPGVPDGWKLVPVEPTEAMMRAAMEALAALIVPAEQVRTAITNIDRALSKQRSGE